MSVFDTAARSLLAPLYAWFTEGFDLAIRIQIPVTLFGCRTIRYAP